MSDEEDEVSSEVLMEEWPQLGERTVAYQTCMDYTYEASRNRLEPIWEQDASLDYLMSLLTLGKSASIMLVGPTGVGKTALVKGLAQRIVRGECPAALAKRRVLRTSVDDLYAVASQKDNPWAEERRLLRSLFREARAQRHILFYDNMHTLFSYPLSTPLIKEEISEGGVCFVGACQTEHYYTFSQKNRNLLDLFLRVDVPPTTPESTRKILGYRLRQNEPGKGSAGEESALRILVEHTANLIPYAAEPGRSLKVLDKVILEDRIRGISSGITQRAVEEAICEMVRIPLTMLTGARDQLLGMETFLNSRVLGQEEAVAKLCRRLIVTKSQATVEPQRPDGVFLFVGPTGVGKTELARALAEYLTGKADNIVRLDMSLFSDPESSRTLLGKPGNNQNSDDFTAMPSISREIMDRPYTVLLLDEIEKAHPAIRLIFLNAIDTGRLQDNLGNIIYLSNAVVVMTSNAGFSTRKAVMAHPGRKSDELARQEEQAVMRALHEVFPPEFIGRIDEVLLFKQLTKAIMKGFISQKVKFLERSLGKSIALTKAAVEMVYEQGFSVEFGARQLNRAVDRIVGYPVALLKTQSENWPEVKTIALDCHPGDACLTAKAGL